MRNSLGLGNGGLPRTSNDVPETISSQGVLCFYLLINLEQDLGGTCDARLLKHDQRPPS